MSNLLNQLHGNKEYKDWRGTVIRKGSKIVYPSGSSSSICVREAIVTDVIPTAASTYHAHSQWRKDFEYKVKAQPIREVYYSIHELEEGETRPVTIHSVERITVLES